MARQLTIELVADSSKFEGAMKGAGAATEKFADKADAAAKDAGRFSKSIDGAASATDASESKFMGAADLLDGLGGAFGIPTEGATNMARSMGDLTGGFTALAPMIGGVSTALKTQLGAALSFVAAHPVILAVGALAVAFVLLWKNCETFRDIVTSAFEAVKSVVQPIIDIVGGAVKWLGGMFGGGGDKAEEMEVRTSAAFRKLQEAHAEHRAEAEEWASSFKSSVEAATSPMQLFEVDTANSLNAVQHNLVKNIENTQKWVDDLNTLVARGYGQLAVELQKMGPQWATAVDEAAKGPDSRLRHLEGMFQHSGRLAGSNWAGAAAAEIHGFMGGMGGQSTGHGASGTWGPATTGPITITRRAAGGPVIGGNPYFVGENGPELFVPSASGTVVPNGGTSTTIVLQLDGRVLTKAVVDGLNREQRSSGVVTKLAS